MKTQDVNLTDNETTVLKLVVEGLTYPAIANRMGKGYETVKRWATRIRAKTGAHTKVAMALWAKANLE